MDPRPALALLACLLACSLPPPSHDCRTDDDCVSGHVCWFGTCNPPCRAGEACTYLGSAGTCESGVCVANGCTLPPANLGYVQYGAHTAAAIGSQDCPFTSLGSAFDALAGGGTILVRGSSPVAIGGRTPPDHVDVLGADDDFVACSEASCPDSSEWPTLNIDGAHAGFNVVTAGDHHLAYLQIRGPGAALTTWSGIAVGNTTATLDHLRISGFHDGIHADQDSVVSIHDDVQCTGNHHGAVADPATSLTIEVAADQAPSQFNDNESYGIYVSGATLFTLHGQPMSGATPGTNLQANGNGGSGLRLSSSASGTTVDGLTASSNGNDSTAANRDGIYLLADGYAKIRNSVLANNLNNGITIGPSGGNSVDHLDLGGDTGLEAGDNLFFGNANTGLCVSSNLAAALAAAQTRVHAAGNQFSADGTRDCRTTTAKLNNGATCNGGADYSDHCRFTLMLDTCTDANEGNCPGP